MRQHTAEVAVAVSGTVDDRPWGVTLGSFARTRATGELVVLAPDGKRHSIAFVNGALVGATSPLTADSVARIAVTSHLVAPNQASLMMRALAAHPRDEFDIV